jgi:ribosomal protein L11 methylase PrmA
MQKLNNQYLKISSDNNFNKNNVKIYAGKILSNYFWKFVDAIANKNWKIAKIYEKVIGDEYKKEYKNFKISEVKNVLHIGCGSYPLSEITLASLSVEKIVGIDKNIKAVLSARKIIHRKKLDKKVTIHHGNGIDYPVDEFDVIIISSCSIPKKKVLKNILSHSNENSIIIVREIDSLVDNILGYINDYKNIVIKNKIRFKTRFFINVAWHSILLKNKG